MSPLFVSLPPAPFPGSYGIVGRSFQNVRTGQIVESYLIIVASHTKFFLIPQCPFRLLRFAVPMDSWPLCIGFSALHQELPMVQYPSVLPLVSSKAS